MSQLLQFEQWLPYPIEHVFSFFSNPENLPRIMPASSAARLEDGKRVPPENSLAGVSVEKAAGAGSVLVTSFRILPQLPLRTGWIARITEFEWNDHFR